MAVKHDGQKNNKKKVQTWSRIVWPWVLRSLGPALAFIHNTLGIKNTQIRLHLDAYANAGFTASLKHKFCFYFLPSSPFQ